MQEASPLLPVSNLGLSDDLLVTKKLTFSDSDYCI